MFPLRRIGFLSLLLASGSFAQESKDTATLLKSDDSRDQSALRKLTDRSFVHDAANMSFTLAESWSSVPPQSLTRKIDPRITSVLSFRDAKLDILATVYWMKLNKGQNFSDWIRNVESAGEYGEEYETLEAIYGKARVTEPVKTRVGEFDTFRINITGGPDRGDKYDGTLILFSNEFAGDTWIVKVRMGFPKQNKAASEQAIAAVLGGFKSSPEKTLPDYKKKLLDPESPSPEKSVIGGGNK